LLANTGFQPINGGFYLPDIQAATEPDVYSEQDLVGSHLHGQDVADGFDRRIFF
jgi:hypothetical protein